MLSFRLALSDLARAAWHGDHDRWRCGGSWVQPISHPALRNEIHHAQHTTTILVRDLASPVTLAGPTPPEPGRKGTHGAARGDAVVLHLQPGRITISAGIGGTVPLYLAAEGEFLYGTWDLPALRRLLRSSSLRDRAVARALTRRHRYSSDTLFTDVTMLTERATATFTTAGLQLTYPPPAEHVTRARELRSGADPFDALAHLLTEAIHPWRAGGALMGLELSGGLDSATVAIAAHEPAGPALRTFGLLIEGALGTEQHRRRLTIAEHVRATDDVLRAHEHAPFCAGGIRARGAAHDPGGEFYREAFEALADRAARHGVTIMLTGNGGDEIMAPRPDELPPPPPQSLAEVSWLGPRARDALATIDDNLAPSAVLPTPTLMGFAIHHPAYLRAGIWPVTPFTHPRLVRFAEQLPLEMRRGKKLYRDFLTRAGLPRSVTHPERTENFRDLMQHGLRHHGLPLANRLLGDGMLLTDHGFIDPDALQRTVRDAHQSDTVPSVLCDTLALEVGLRSLLTPDPAPVA
ncbi:asparagine synthase C-terminal domain-containing protein [Amycolatopsis sp. NBC_01480]|uniref:asparagine synthase C-terminal domain-containing protein n=1 Tax=Amycolatopsis sp. NBC_01480 TaxID=2903562 RepID=UPI002E292006|nr:asparagine synthase C-terminal domain-containing protein [Amycolatopsis sp. NBC_01480]